MGGAGGEIPGVTVPGGQAGMGGMGGGGGSFTGLDPQSLAQRFTPEQAAALAQKLMAETIEVHAQRLLRQSMNGTINVEAIPPEIRAAVIARTEDLQAEASHAGSIDPRLREIMQSGRKKNRLYELAR